MTLFRSTRLFAASFCFLAFLNAPSLAQEADRPETAAAPEQAPTVATPEIKTAPAEIPDISGRWQTGETKRSVQGFISKTETPEVFSVAIIANRSLGGGMVGPQQKNGDEMPPFSFSSNFSVTWNPPTSQFLCDQKLRKIAMTRLEDGNRLKVETTVDEQSLKELSEQERKEIKSVQEWAFNPLWIRSTAIFNGYDNIESKNLIIVASKEGLAAYNKSIGKWTKIKVDVSKCSMDPFSRSLISDSFFSIVIENRIHAFSAVSGKWDSLLIPPEQMSTVAPTHGNSSLIVRIGDKLYALSPTSGRWTSPDDSQANQENQDSSRETGESKVVSATEKTPLNQKSPEMAELTTKISSEDVSAAEQANGIRKSLKQKGISLEASRDHAETRDAWTALERTLNDAFDAKTKLERLRIQELRRRLDQSEALIEKRQAQKDQIVKRRATELVEGEETQWPVDDAPLVGKQLVEVSGPETGVAMSLESSDPIFNVLGLYLEPLTEAQKATLKKTKYRNGMRVAGTVRKSPMWKQGVRTGDILVGLEQWETTNPHDIRWILNRLLRDASSSGGLVHIKFLIVRNGDEKHGQIQIPVGGSTNDEREVGLEQVEPASEDASEVGASSEYHNQVAKILGLRLEPLTEADKLQLKKSKYRGGLRVAEVLTGFPQDKGVKAGDILVGLDKWEVTNLESVIWIANQIQRDAQSVKGASDHVGLLLLKNGELFISSVIIRPLKTPRTSNPTAVETDAMPRTNSGDNEIWPFLDRVATIGEELIAAKQAHTYTSALYSKKVISKDEMDRVDLRLATARRRFENLSEECGTKLEELGADLEASRSDVQVAKELVSQAEEMQRNARGSYASVIQEKRKLAQAEALVPRIEAKLKVLRRAEEDLKKIKQDANLNEIAR